MKIIKTIKKKAMEIMTKKNDVFSVPIEKQKEILRSFPQPIDLIERSFFQYKCQMKLIGKWRCLLLNLFAIPLCLLCFCKKCKSICDKEQHYEAIFFADGKPSNIIPDELRQEFSKIDIVEKKKARFTKLDREYVMSLWKRYPFSCFFIWKCLVKIQYYSYEIDSKLPKAILVCNEYSFTSSMLTDYCHKRKVLNINLMHGEKLFHIMDAFFKYDRCYVWSEEYIKLFIKLRADSGQFVVAVPKSLRFEDQFVVDKIFDYKYYLCFERGNQLAAIIKILKTLSKNGSQVAIRPHPRYSDINEVKKLSDGMVLVEDYSTVSIEQSILETENVVSLFSTVLTQAYQNGVRIIIDDVTDKEKYMQLKEMDYVMMTVKHIRLSELLHKL